MRANLVWAGIWVTDFVYPGDKPGFYLAWQAVFVAFCENGYDISQKKHGKLTKILVYSNLSTA